MSRQPARPHPGPHRAAHRTSWASPSVGWWRPPPHRSTNPTPCSSSSRPSTCRGSRPTRDTQRPGIDGGVRAARAGSTPLRTGLAAAAQPEGPGRTALHRRRHLGPLRPALQPSGCPLASLGPARPALVPRRTRVDLLGRRRPTGDRRAASIRRPCVTAEPRRSSWRVSRWRRAGGTAARCWRGARPISEPGGSPAASSCWRAMSATNSGVNGKSLP